MKDFLIVGLGNPGEQYQLTRHNAGFLVLEELARFYRVRWQNNKLYGKAVVTDGERRLYLVKPLTYMNRSGEAVKIFLDQYHLPLERVIIISDDMALPFGKIRLKPRGSSGGHNGLASVIAVAGPDFPRLRVGIGRPPDQEGMVDYVLGCFTAEEQEFLPAVTRRAAQAIISWCEEGIEKAMSKFNGPVPLE
ncbi:MAG TPA: aminoacyl-tRNA hydrolase [Firmicutes bacterium]|uniref:Peptidyl-tRNA hydrolase n=1 Tax=Capillibacterium thermochitinicola TaxID=2699427 RepID=A0A8J6I2X9_9FIRM|nr:aminoacyl-tRNA hydrolase [Capillibacterium thermochitinicola]MBA2133704.1 aminoacyl-tRNA hydrolase [Capillibacterium thermochitinicola]HHW11868.1 aminoacyl-tRNA hydrolase [Bacillota bacterium]